MSFHPIISGQAGSNATTPGLFRDPLSRQHSLLRRIGNVCFHIFTLGIPLVAYYILNKCFSNKSLIRKALSSDMPVSKLGCQAIERAKLLVDNVIASDEEDEITDYQITNGRKNLPLNYNISRLAYIYDKVLWPKFTNMLIAENENASEDYNNKILELTEDLFKVHYAMNMLMLDDIDGYISMRERCHSDKISSREEAVTSRHGYFATLFHQFSNLYFQIRYDLRLRDDSGILKVTDNINDASTDKFYESGTAQYRMRLLFNEFCDRYKSYLNEGQMLRMDRRFEDWMRKDNNKETYRSPLDPPANLS